MEKESKVRSMNKQRVPVFVEFTDGALKFYAFHDSMHCPIFDVEVPKPESSKHVAQPFTCLTTSPIGCSFVSAGDQFYLIGGTIKSGHEINAPIDDDGMDDMPFDDTPVPDVCRVSTRVKRFDCQRFVNSLADSKDERKIEIVELDGNEVSSGHWETCASLSVARNGASLLYLGGRLYAVGGTYHFEHEVNASFIEVFEDGVWTPLTTHNPPDIHPYFFTAVALPDSNKILIGSKGGFYELNVGTARWEELVGLECPHQFLVACSGTPGVVVHNHFVMWYGGLFDRYGLCIRGLDLGAKKHFYVDILKKLVDLKRKNYDYAQSAKLIGMGDEEGSLCLIYYAPNLHFAVDEHGQNTFVGEYHCVTFQIIFDKLAVENKPFPGVELETRVISHHKCFALSEGDMEGYIEAAFAMDVCFPKRRISPNTCDIGEASGAD